MTIETDTFTFPAHFASAFVNGDTSGLTDKEGRQFNKIVASIAPWHIVDVAGEDQDARFTWSYALYNDFGDTSIRGGDVLDYVAHRIID